MNVVSRPTRKKSWQKIGEVVNLLDALAAKESEVAERLEMLRKAHGLSQETAAHEVGVSIRQWQRWASGESEPRASNLARISERFDVAISEIVGAGSASQFDRMESRLAHIEDQLGQLLGAVGADPEQQGDLSDQIIRTVERALNQRATEVGRPPSKRAQRPGRPGVAPGRAA